VAAIKFIGAQKRYGAVEVIRDLDLEIRDREFMVLVGPSGCGKTTALRMIAGLEELSGGELRIGERLVNDVHPKDRDVAMVFQSYALYPHMSVFENLAFGLRTRGFPADDIKRRVEEAATVLGLGALLDRRPKALSGGQRQRVALGRAIVRQPAVFLFDEPLSNLDAELRVQMRAELARLQQRLATTTVYVTHDQVEAMTLGQRIAVFAPLKAPGERNLQQVGTPLEIYDRPANVFVATFMGSPRMNLLRVTVGSDGQSLEAPGIRIPVREDRGLAAGQQLTAGIRPEHVGDRAHVAGEGAVSLKGTVEIIETIGHEVIVHVRVGGQPVIAKLGPGRAPAFGETLELLLNAGAVHLFDPITGRRLECPAGTRG